MSGTKHKIAITRFPFESQLGGEELHTLQVAEHWRGQGYEVVFLGSCPVLRKMFKENKFKVVRYKLAKPPVTEGQLFLFTLFYPWHFFKAWRLSKKLRKFTHVYCLSFTEKLLLPWFLKKQRYYFVEHARIGRWFTKNPWRSLYYQFAKKGQVVTVSKMMADDLKYPQAVVIPNGVDTAKFARSNLDRDWGRLQITTVGRLTDDKGMTDFVEAMIGLSKTGIEWQATIVGQGPQEKFLRAKIAEAGLQKQIKLITKLPRPELIKLLQKIDVFCLLSPQVDPFGLVVAEAMAAGAVPIATDKCGIIDYSDLIYKVPANDAEAVVKAIKQILVDKIAVEVVQKEAQAKFDLNKMLAAYDGLLR